MAVQRTRRLLLCLVFIGLTAACSQAPRPAAPNAIDMPAAETDFRFVKNQILVDVMIGENGPYTFLVDTGVTPSAVDTDLAISLGLPVNEDASGEASGVGSEEVRIFPTVIEDLSVADAPVGPLEAVAFPFAGLSEKAGEPLHGVLGHAFLENRAIRIDYVSRHIAFADSAAPFSEDFDNADFITPLRFAGGDIMPVVDVRIGEHGFVASVDTGSSLGLEIFADAVARLHLSGATEEWERSEVTGARGDAEIRNGVLPLAEIGDLRFENIPASIGPRRGGDYRDGNIGNRLWDGYVVVFDYVEDRIAFRKTGGAG